MLTAADASNSEAPMSTRPLQIVGIGGTLRENSSSGRALKFSLDIAAAAGAHVQLFTGEALQVPLYDPGTGASDQRMGRMIAALRCADGILIASPGYHGSLSGTVKNALDYTEEMARDGRPYFDGRAVGCIAAAAGWQAAGATLSALRAIVHALRGWPTPIGVLLNSSEPQFDADGRCLVPQMETALKAMVEQVMAFATGTAQGRST
jgi:FMN reductase